MTPDILSAQEDDQPINWPQRRVSALNAFISTAHKIIRPHEMTISSMSDALCISRIPRFLGSDKETWRESATFIRLNHQVGIQTVSLTWKHPFASGKRSNEVKETVIVRLQEDYIDIETVCTNISHRKNGIDQVERLSKQIPYSSPDGIGHYLFVVDAVFNGLIDHTLKAGYQPNVVRPLLSHIETVLTQLSHEDLGIAACGENTTPAQEVARLHIRLNQLRSNFATISS